MSEENSLLNKTEANDFVKKLGKYLDKKSAETKPRFVVQLWGTAGEIDFGVFNTKEITEALIEEGLNPEDESEMIESWYSDNMNQYQEIYNIKRNRDRLRDLLALMEESKEDEA